MLEKEARYYRREGEDIYCTLCPHGCRIKDGQKGVCGVRLAKSGKLITLNYARCASMAMDPIEKKPLYHFYPGWEILSVGTFGCNLHCAFCQNWTLARGEDMDAPGWKEIGPEMFPDILKGRPRKEQLGVAYTYNEPGIWYEFVLDTAGLLAGKGFKNVLVTNGHINPEPLEELLPFIDAANIDVKAFNDNFYRRYCRGRGLGEVLRTVEKAHTRCHVELTYLVINTLNDNPDEISEFVSWVASLDKNIPVHFSRYFPNYHLDIPPTSLTTMQEVWEIATQKLSYVYLGNIRDDEYSTTFCPSCRRPLITRDGYRVQNAGLDGKRCENCGYTINLTGHIYEVGGNCP
ncbi:MAG: AmmeMemoRadiSam system radical SAM enzyme [Dethiobacteria bacterium]|jgi:pyruvate formate lyase activating enzyme